MSNNSIFTPVPLINRNLGKKSAKEKLSLNRSRSLISSQSGLKIEMELFLSLNFKIGPEPPALCILVYEIELNWR
jgi:hypothetical protein